MDDPRDAEDATRELDGSRMCGRRVKVSLGQLLQLLPPSRTPGAFLWNDGHSKRINHFQQNPALVVEKIFILKFSSLDLPASLPFPSLHSPLLMSS